MTKKLDKAVEETVEKAVEVEQANDEALAAKSEADETKKMSRQDESWELVTFLNFTWTEASAIKGKDREYLLNKAEEVKLEVLRRRKLEMEQAEREEMMRQQQQAQQQQMFAQQQLNNPPHQWAGQQQTQGGPASMQAPSNAQPPQPPPHPQQQWQQQHRQQQQGQQSPAYPQPQ